LYGKWRNPANPKVAYLVEKDARKGYFKRYDIDSAGNVGKVAQPVIMSVVEDRIFLSAFTPADDVEVDGYYLYEFRKVSDKEFKLVPVKENKVSHALDYDTPSEKIKPYLQQKINDKTIYDLEGIETYMKQ
jgi:hypothetical protein